MKNIVLVCLFLTFMLFGCLGKSQEAVQKGDFNVEFLFEKDGCKLYRFKDGGRYIYWANCAGRVSKDAYHSTGKSGYMEHQQTIITE